MNSESNLCRFDSDTIDKYSFNELFNVVFVFDNHVMSDNGSIIIFSLIDEFIKINKNNIRQNLELSQYYCSQNAEDCEIVLKYNSINMYLENHNNINHGSIHFFIKKEYQNQFRYYPIFIVKINIVNTLKTFMNEQYHNTEEIMKLESHYKKACNLAHSDYLSKNIKNGLFSITNEEDIICSTTGINKILDEIKNICFETQLSKIDRKRILSMVPHNRMIDIAHLVANYIMKTTYAKQNSIKIVLVPGNSNIILDKNNHPISILIDANIAVLDESDDPKGSSTNNIVKISDNLHIFSGERIYENKHLFNSNNININIDAKIYDKINFLENKFSVRNRYVCTPIEIPKSSRIMNIIHCRTNLNSHI